MPREQVGRTWINRYTVSKDAQQLCFAHLCNKHADTATHPSSSSSILHPKLQMMSRFHDSAPRVTFLIALCMIFSGVCCGMSLLHAAVASVGSTGALLNGASSCLLTLLET